RVLKNQVLNEHALSLPDPMAAILSLAQISWHPIQFREYDVRGTSQSDSYSGCLDIAKKQIDFAGLKIVYCLLPSSHRRLASQRYAFAGERFRDSRDSGCSRLL